MFTHHCSVCGKEFKTPYRRQYYCPHCKSEYNRKYYEEEKKEGREIERFEERNIN